MTASEMKQRLGSFCKRDFRVWRQRQWWLWWHRLLDCSSRMLMIWIVSSSEDSSCSQGHKKQAKQSQRPSSTPWSSMVCQWGMKVLLYRKILTRQRTSQSWRRGCWTPWEHSTEAQGTKWFSGTGSEAWLQKGTQERKLLCVRDPWTLCQGLQEEGDCTMQQVWWERLPR